jgi:hypothetical protein
MKKQIQRRPPQLLRETIERTAASRGSRIPRLALVPPRVEAEKIERVHGYPRARRVLRDQKLSQREDEVLSPKPALPRLIEPVPTRSLKLPL